MEAGLADHVWSSEELVGLLERKEPNMKPYFYFVTSALWIIVAVLFSFGRFSFGISWSKGTVNPVTVAGIFSLTSYLIVFGWIVPIALGLWLLWARR